MALEWDTTGEIDQEVFLLESVVSVQDNGKWVADLDVLLLEREAPDLFVRACQCPLDATKPTAQDVVSLDSWNEVLDAPPCVGVLRASNNWVARLAAVSILIQRNAGHAILVLAKGPICWRCLEDAYSGV